MAQSDTQVKEKIKTKLDLAKPSMFNVIYMNDETTTMEFVVVSLMEIFGHDEEVANDLCMLVHTDGSAIVATLPYEIAEQKGVEATVLARNNGFPLMIRLEAAL